LGLLFRPQLIGSDAAMRLKLLGDIRRRGVWQVTDEEFWIGVGDVRLDMTEAEIPTGETCFRIWSIVSPVRLTVPEDVAVSVSSTAFVTESRFLGRKRDTIMAPFRASSQNYEIAERQIRLEVTSFVGDIRVLPV
jgi:lia operon protein LiaF